MNPEEELDLNGNTNNSHAQKLDSQALQNTYFFPINPFILDTPSLPDGWMTHSGR